MSDKLILNPHAALLATIPEHERGARSEHQLIHALQYLGEWKCHLIPSHGLAHSAADRATAFNSVAELRRYAERYAHWDYLLRCEPGDPFVCIRVPDAENLAALEKLTGRIDTVSIMSADGGDAFLLFRAPTRTTYYDSNRDMAETYCRVSRFSPLPGALCRRTNRPYQYAKCCAPVEVNFAPITSRLASILPKKPSELSAPPVASGRYGQADYSERYRRAPDELEKNRERQRKSRAAAKAAKAA